MSKETIKTTIIVVVAVIIATIAMKKITAIKSLTSDFEVAS